MLLSALIGLGCPLSYLKDEFKKINLDFNIKLLAIKKGHVPAKKIIFSGDTNLSYKNIIRLIKNSKLDNKIKEKITKAYQEIFDIEKKIHRIKKKDFHFHHLGEVDAILEICGFFLALEYLKVDNVFVSPLPLDLPAPATLEVLKHKKINMVNFGYETITPTAAILLKETMQIDRSFNFSKFSIAYGDCGDKDYLVAYLTDQRTKPACRQAGTEDQRLEIEKDKIIKVETNIDDMNPQIFEQLFDVLCRTGAKEIYVEQVIMKKTRPGFVLNILCAPDDFPKIRDIIFSHTSTFGIRYQEYCRDKLKYKFIYKNTKLGKIKFRVSEPPFKKETPEYEDCLALSKKLNIPLFEIYRNL